MNGAELSESCLRIPSNNFEQFSEKCSRNPRAIRERLYYVIGTIVLGIIMISLFLVASY